MTTPSTLHPVSTSLPDDLWEAFEAERTDEDRNIAQHLRVIVRRYFDMRRDATPMPTITLPRDFAGSAHTVNRNDF